MTYQMITYKSFTIIREGNTYNLKDEMGFWVGHQATLSFAKENIDEIIQRRVAR
jgi:hypothetical protein